MGLRTKSGDVGGSNLMRASPVGDFTRFQVAEAPGRSKVTYFGRSNARHGRYVSSNCLQAIQKVTEVIQKVKKKAKQLTSRTILLVFRFQKLQEDRK